MLPENTAEVSTNKNTDVSADDLLFLAAIQDIEKRKEVISILKRAGLIPA